MSFPVQLIRRVALLASVSHCLGFAVGAERLLNIDFDTGTASSKRGFAAIGQSETDFWNLYSRDDGQGGFRYAGVVADLKWNDGTPANAAVSVRNAAGAWPTGSDDPMFRGYLYPLGGESNVTVTLVGLPPGNYDVYVYGHGAVDAENGVYTLASGGSDYGPLSTTTGSGWTQTQWLEGQQYVAFRGLVLTASIPMVLTAKPGASPLAVINGMQLVWKDSPPPQPIPVAGKALFNLDFDTGTASGKAGFAAVGKTPEDFWNLYSRDDGAGGFRDNGTLPETKWADGSPAPISIAVRNAAGAWPSGSADPMFRGYLYPLSRVGNIEVNVTRLPAGTYDVLVYGHGAVNGENGVYSLTGDWGTVGPLLTTTNEGWAQATWEEGLQYVVFRDVAVSVEGQLTLAAQPGVNGLAVINGMQLVWKNEVLPPSPPPVAGLKLLNVDFDTGTNSAKVGFAAAGKTLDDYWNLYSRDDGNGGFRDNGILADMKWADGQPAGVVLSVQNAAGAWPNGSTDPMYRGYLYPLSRSGDLSVMLSGLPGGSYDLYIYGHGAVDAENGNFTVAAGGVVYGPLATTTGDSWSRSGWQEGAQYVRFENVAFSTGTDLAVTAHPGASGLAVINGLQLVWRQASLPDTQAPVAGKGLLSIDFDTGTASAKRGFAAVGKATNDWWNLYSRDDGRGGFRFSGILTNLSLVDGTPIAASLAVTNAAGAWPNGSPDPMFRGYLYPLSGQPNLTVTFTDLMAGKYDIYIYGHGAVDAENGVYSLRSGQVDYGTLSTTSGNGWTLPTWQEGAQYVVFRDVAVARQDPVAVTVVPGASPLAVLNGMQLVWKASLAPMIERQPQTATLQEGDTLTLDVLVSGDEPLQYQWRLDGVNLPGASDRVLIRPNTLPTMSGKYTVVVSNEAGSVLSEEASIRVEPLATSILQATRTATGLRVEAAAASGKIYSVDISGDLVHWTTIAILFNVSGRIEFIDPMEQGQSMRFYRVREGF